MNRKKRDITRFALIIAIIILINVIGSLRFFRLDLTSENRYSLSPATIELLESFEDQLLFKIYLEGDFPAGFQRLQMETKQMLDEFRAYNPNIQYLFVNPNAQGEKKREELYQQLQSRGLRPYQLSFSKQGSNSRQTIFPGGLMSLGEKEISVSLLTDQIGVSPEAQINNSIQNLEFTLASGIKSLTVQEKPSVAFLQGHGELGPQKLADFAKNLSRNYNVDLFNIREFKSDTVTGEVSIAEQQARLNRFDALIVAKPQKAFNDLDKYLIDQFVMTGGKSIWLVDPVKAEMDSLSEKSQFLALPIYDRLNIGDLLFKYGVRLNTNLVTDMVAAGVNDQKQVRPWVYFPMVMPQTDHPIAKDLNAIWLQFASTLDTIITEGSRKTVLLRSSPYSATYATPHLVNLGLLYNPPPRERFTKRALPLAVLVEGRFESLYKNRIQPKDNGESLKVVGSVKNNQMLVVGDGDIVANQLNVVNPNIPRGAPLPLGYDQYTGQEYGNSDFLMNALDHMLDESGLISIRSRELKIRLLDLNRVSAEKLYWQLVNTLLPLLLILLFGVVYAFIRKRRFAR